MSEGDVVWIAVKNRQAKDMNRQPFYFVRPYKVARRTEKAVILKCGKVYPHDRCFVSEEDCKRSIGGLWKRRGEHDLTAAQGWRTNE